MNKRHWRIITKRGYLYDATFITTKANAMMYLNIWGDAICIQKVKGWFKRFIMKN
jgi:hypothetical protein